MAHSSPTARVSSTSCSTDSLAVPPLSPALPCLNRSSESGVSDNLPAPSNVFPAHRHISTDPPSNNGEDDIQAMALRGTVNRRRKGSEAGVPDLRGEKRKGAMEGRKEAKGDGIRRNGNKEQEEEGCYDNVACRCAASVTADCAALCCCPLAILHLGVLALVRLPTAVVWKMLVSINERLCMARKPSIREMEKRKEMEGGSSRSLSHPVSPETARIEQIGVAHGASLDWEVLCQNFQTEGMEFGGVVHRREE